jgi:hypothetical protein
MDNVGMNRCVVCDTPTTRIKCRDCEEREGKEEKREEPQKGGKNSDNKRTVAIVPSGFWAF